MRIPNGDSGRTLLSPRAVPDVMSKEMKHICVCICTYKRPEFLRRSLQGLLQQKTGGIFTFSILVADNDYLESAKTLVAEFASKSEVAIRYCVQPTQNIALNRNKAIENAHGDYVAFIDDDEIPTDGWLKTLFTVCQDYGVDGVLGPVKPQFDVEPPKWVVSAKFYDRPTYPTGFLIDWRKGRTGNVLLKREIFDPGELPFRPEFPTGEDQDFFRRMIEKGHRFIWCNEAVAFEVVPPIRWNLSFMLRRALLRGKASLAHPTFGARDIVISIIAVGVYTVALPFSLLVGHDKFMLLLVKLFDHLGRILAAAGLNPIRDSYVTE